MIAELLLNSFEKQIEPQVSFSQKRCLRNRLSSNNCDICLNLCRHKALALSGRMIVFSADKCSGCMACVLECPNEAFAGKADVLLFIKELQRSDNEEPLVLSCGRAHTQGEHAPVPCLGLLSEPVLAALHCIALRKLYLDTRRCAHCSNSHVPGLLDERIKAVEKKLGRPAGFTMFNEAEKNPGSEVGRQRRFLLRSAKKSLIGFGKGVYSTVDAAGNAGEQGSEIGKQGNRLSRLLHHAFEQLPSDADEEKKLLRSYFFSLNAGQSCSLCPACTGMCPTGALRRRGGSEGKQLVFTSARCSGCGLCVAFCREKALTLRQGGAAGLDDPAAALAIA